MPRAPVPPALPAVAKVAAIPLININKDLDPKVLEIYNLSLPSDLMRDKLAGVKHGIEITSGILKFLQPNRKGLSFNSKKHMNMMRRYL